MSEQPKPCPCCGSAAYLDYQANAIDEAAEVFCTGCRLTTPMYPRHAHAVEAWNLRRCLCVEDSGDE